MFENYRYFLLLCSEKNVTRAAEKLFVTHQCLSRYLKKLEEECGATLFSRKPSFALTPDGEKMLETLRRVERLENDLRSYYEQRRGCLTGCLRFGTTEGRFRIFVPDLIGVFQTAFPRVELQVISANSTDLRASLLDNKLDIALCGKSAREFPLLEEEVVLNERLYLVVSDGILNHVFGENWRARLDELRGGADLRLFRDIPFAVNMPEFNSSQILGRHLKRIGLKLNVIHTSSHPDLHHVLTSHDYAASFCLTMYLPGALRLNETCANKLHALPIAGLTETNPITVLHIKERLMPRPALELCRILKDLCGKYAQADAV